MAIPTIPSRPAVVANGLTYYVDNTAGVGDDAHTTTEAQNAATPWATIAASLGKITPGDTLLVKPGDTEYARTTVPTLAGNASAWTRILGVYDNGYPACVGFLLDTDAVQYCEIANFNIVADSRSPVDVRNGNTNLYLHNIDADGAQIPSGEYGGFSLGYNAAGETPVSDVYIEDCMSRNNSQNGFTFYAGTSNVTCINCVAKDNVGDGFSGYSNPESSYLKVNGYFVDCTATNNQGDGFDLGFGLESVHLRCISTGNRGVQGVGFKCWGGGSGVSDIWYQECQSYDNQYYGIEVKNFTDANVYIDGCYLADNTWGKCLRTINDAQGTPFGIPTLHITNNIMYNVTSTQPAYEFANDRTIIATADNNTVIADAYDKFLQVRDQGQAVLVELTYASMPENPNKTDGGYVSADMDQNSIIYSEQDGQIEAPAQIKPYPVIELQQGEHVSIDLAAGYWSFGQTYAGAVPFGLTLSSSGMLSGTPSGTVSSAGFIITATNATGPRESTVITATLKPSLSNFSSAVSGGTCTVSFDTTNAGGVVYYRVQEVPIPGDTEQQKIDFIIGNPTGMLDTVVEGSNSFDVAALDETHYVGIVQESSATDPFMWDFYTDVAPFTFTRASIATGEAIT